MTAVSADDKDQEEEERRDHREFYCGDTALIIADAASRAARSGAEGSASK
jgi:hypothetical protein